MRWAVLGEADKAEMGRLVVGWWFGILWREWRRGSLKDEGGGDGDGREGGREEVEARRYCT